MPNLCLTDKILTDGHVPITIHLLRFKSIEKFYGLNLDCIVKNRQKSQLISCCQSFALHDSLDNYVKSLTM